jgi:ATP-dependent RNA helicase DeaD
VLDEADEMLDLGFREDMEFILETTPETRRTLLFSATLPRGIIALAKQYQQQAFRIEVAGDEGGHADIEYRAIRIAASDVDHAVVNVLRFFESPSALVFCNTRNAVRQLQATLLERGFSVVALSGELTQNERTQALQALRDGRARVCVASDVAARGIDLPNLDLVIHADIPNDPEVMQHRSGRTGRAGRKGVSVLLVPPARRRRAELLLNLAGIDGARLPSPRKFATSIRSVCSAIRC